MLIIIATISILTITAAVWLLNRALPFQICPICAGVAGTWIWLVAAHLLGYQINLVVPALLLGGSIVGIAYQSEKKLPPKISPLLWKIVFIPAGFIAAYGLLEEQWIMFLVSLGFLLVVGSVFFFGYGGQNPREEGVKELEKKMKNCC
ncbi:MAG: hypothetical protein AAB355_00545 [Patescibacteria group bacterium]